MKRLLFIVSMLCILLSASSVSHAAFLRYVDLQNGAMYDIQTGLTWLKNANCFGEQIWNNAADKANSLSSGQCGLSDGSSRGAWRLPSEDELRIFLQDIDPQSGFQNANSMWFWSSTFREGPGYWSDGTNTYWSDGSYGAAGLYNGIYAGYSGMVMESALSVWPVRSGQFDSLMLSVSKTGTGSGTVTSSVGSLNCGSACSATITPGASVTLTASPDSGSTFTGWSGACSGTGVCTMTMDAAKNVTATFTASAVAPTTAILSVSKTGTGSGTVTSSYGGVNCGSTCSATITTGISVTLTATPASASTFAGWSGACSGTGSCTVTMDEAKSVTATFITSAVASATVPADQRGGKADNPDTVTDIGGPGACTRQGLPTYGVNTSFLNLSIEDTDFAWASFGHDLALRRTWNMQSGVTGMFGNGWSFAYESTLRTVGSATTVKLGSGQQYSYTTSTSQGQGSGTVTLSHAYSTGAVKPILTGYISEATGGGYYTFVDKSSKLTNRYDYANTDATTGEKVYRLTSITDRNGNALTLTYDSSARLATLTDASNRTTTFSYDGNSHAIQISTFNNKTATFQYDSAGNLVRNVDLAGNVITYAYDANNLITSMTAAGKTTGFSYVTDSGNNKYVSTVTDTMGNMTKYEFLAAGGTRVTEPGGGIRSYTHSSGRTTSVTDQLNHTTSTAFNSNWLPSTTTDEQGRVTRYEYDVSGNLTKLTDPAGKITTFEYDANWNLTKKTDSLGNSWTYTYNTNNNLTGTASPLGRTNILSVDTKGLVTRVTAPDGSFSIPTYDSHGNLTALTNPLNKSSTYGYDVYGLERISATDARANTTNFSYDPNRLLTSKTLPDNKSIQYSYACNALTSTTDGGGNTTTLQRDNLLRVTRITNPLGKFSSLVYNSDGFRTSTTDPLGRITSSGYDAAHRVTSITNPLNKTILFNRNADGSPSSITNELGKSTVMSYDNRGLLSSITDPLGNATKTSHDDLGRVSSVTNARGKTVSTTYDQDGQETNQKYDGVTVATYDWNSVGQITAMTDSSGVKTFARDAAGQITAIGYPDGTAISLAYDAVGNIGSITYPGGLVVNYSYDSLNRTSGVALGANSLSMSYDATGRLAGETRSNGVQSLYGYDAAGQLASLSHKKGAIVIADLAYTRNDAGLVIRDGGALPLNPVINSSSATGTYNNADGVLTWGGDNYTYDADGNLTAIAGAKTFSAVYDNQNRPTSITLDGATTTYVYDGLGNRVQAQTATATRNFHHDPWGRLLFETNTSGQVTANYIYDGDRLVASGTPAGGYVFYHQDKTGNTLALTDSSGAVVGAYAYSPYGAVLNQSGSTTTPFTYVGAYGVMSEGNALYFMKNRYYDAISGRFIQRDPIGFAGGQSNLYAYVGDNPVTNIDPDGDETLEERQEKFRKRVEVGRHIGTVQSMKSQMGLLRGLDYLARAHPDIAAEMRPITSVDNLLDAKGVVNTPLYGACKVRINISMHHTPKQIAKTLIHEWTHVRQKSNIFKMMVSGISEIPGIPLMMLSNQITGRNES